MNETVLHRLAEVISDRRENPVPGSYTSSLLADENDRILKKLLEEALETALAAKCESVERVASEAADLVYHLLVLLASRGLDIRDVEAELEKRFGRGA